MGNQTTPSASKKPSTTISTRRPPSNYAPLSTSESQPTTTSTSSAAATITANSSHIEHIDFDGIPLPEIEKYMSLLWLAATLALIVVFVLFIIGGFSEEPSPSPSPPKFEIQSVSVSPFNISGYKITAENFNMAFSVTNPDKETALFYDKVVVSVFYRGELLWVTVVEPFYHRTNLQQIIVRASFSASPTVAENWVAPTFVENLKALQPVIFDVKVQSEVRYTVGESKSDQGQMTVSCDDVKILFKSNLNGGGGGTLAGGPKKCSVKVQLEE